MNKILFIVGHQLFPIVTGSRIRTANFFRSLHEDNELYVVYCGAFESVEDQAMLDKYFRRSWYVPMDKGGLKHKPTDHSIFARLSKSWMERNYDDNFEQQLKVIIHQNNFDIVFCRYIHMGMYLLALREFINGKIAIDLDDFEFVKQQRIVNEQFRKFSLKYWRISYDNFLLKKYHDRLRAADMVSVCSEKDMQYAKKNGWSNNISTIPNVIDVLSYEQAFKYDNDVFNQKTLLCCGDLEYEPNVLGLLWFCRNVWPRIIKEVPGTKLFIVGRNPDPRLAEIQNEISIFLYPNVESVRPYYQRASVSVVPLLAGGGTRIKILEAFAALRPVVSTTIGAEGLGVRNRQQLLIADSPAEFAGSCCELLKDYDSAKRMTTEARKFVCERYDYRVLKEEINRLFGGLVER